MLWNLKTNPSKCETIVFHRPRNTMSINKSNDIKNIQIKIKINNNIHTIEHKKVVRYLGVMIDSLLRLNIHITTQLKKPETY